ncbi:MAG: galactose-1-phosphate uridylyltransferase [Anaeroplasma sp.]
MENVYLIIDKLISYAKSNLYLCSKDEDYVRNEIFCLLNLDSCKEKKAINLTDSLPDNLLNELKIVLINENICDEFNFEYYADQIMGYLSMLPSKLEERFYNILNDSGSKAATEWLYDYSIKNDYVKKSKLDLNPRFENNGLIITINKAKPEFRDPKKAQSGNSTKGGYPKCSICHENEGFHGRNKKTLRTIDLSLNNEKWFWQFSPYGYFHQHGIAINYKHTPMHIDKDGFNRLIDFVDLFPHWFIGSNAALPRIGGSVLAHDHYQGGGEILPMQKAKTLSTLKNKKFDDAILEIVDWPNSVIRVVSKNRESICEIAELIRDKWVNYENKELNIICYDEDGLHSAISPSVIKTDRGYEMSIILRNNITSEKYPDGVFHAHPEYHIIKKESIGLIEAQGLFILPGRLEKELNYLEEIVIKQLPLPNELKEYKMIYSDIIDLCCNNFSREKVHQSILDELGIICYKILENTSVFKSKEQLIEFVEDLDFYEI